MFADATMANGLVLMTPLPLTCGLGATIGPLHTLSVFHWRPGGSDPEPGVNVPETDPLEAETETALEPLNELEPLNGEEDPLTMLPPPFVPIEAPPTLPEPVGAGTFTSWQTVVDVVVGEVLEAGVLEMA
jgi:hypothetical protein